MSNQFFQGFCIGMIVMLLMQALSWWLASGIKKWAEKP